MERLISTWPGPSNLPVAQVAVNVDHPAAAGAQRDGRQKGLDPSLPGSMLPSRSSTPIMCG